MKRISVFLLVLIISFYLSACSSNSNNDMVSKAINELKNHWEKIYDETDFDTDGHFEIKNTRVVNIKENDIDEFKDIDYIVEFVLYTDCWGSAPYYQNEGVDDNIVVYKDGTMETQSNSINRYKYKYFSNDFSDFIKSVDDYGDKYNCIENLK